MPWNRMGGGGSPSLPSSINFLDTINSDWIVTYANSASGSFSVNRYTSIVMYISTSKSSAPASEQRALFNKQIKIKSGSFLRYTFTGTGWSTFIEISSDGGVTWDRLANAANNSGDIDLSSYAGKTCLIRVIQTALYQAETRTITRLGIS